MARRFFSAANGRITDLRLQPPRSTSERELLLNKPSPGAVLWCAGQIEDGVMETDWTKYTREEYPSRHQKTQYLIETIINDNKILWLDDKSDYFSLPPEYFVLDTFSLSGLSPEKMNQFKKFRPDMYKKLMKNKGAGVFALNFPSISVDYDGIYVGEELVYGYRHREDIPIADFYAWDVPSLAIWGAGAIKELIHHEFDPNKNPYKAIMWDMLI